MKDEEEKGSGKDSWLSTHDMIQDELLKMKQELIQEKNEEKKEEDIKEANPMVDDIATDQKTESVTESTVPERTQGAPTGAGEMNIKQLLGAEEEKESRKIKERNNERKEHPPRLEKGTIPTSPNLSSKIANVLQLENNLKRRKFDLERKKKKDMPKPPRPAIDPEEEESITQVGKEEKGEEITDQEETRIDTSNSIGPAKNIPDPAKEEGNREVDQAKRTQTRRIVHRRVIKKGDGKEKPHPSHGKVDDEGKEGQEKKKHNKESSFDKLKKLLKRD
ncbi:MAG: hypothetical protein R6V01_03795 [Thermoplasmatota archaeon]